MMRSQSETMLARITADVRRKQDNYLLVNSFVNRYIKALAQLGTLAVVFYRFAYWCHEPGHSLLRLPARLICQLLRPAIVRATGVDIDPETDIGPGLVIHNFSGVFVDAEEIGECLTLNQGTTIGPDFSRTGKPRLGDGVFLGAGARVLGDITIGNHVVVAANALVTRNVPDNCLIAGVPGMIIQKNVPADYVGTTTPHGPRDASSNRAEP